MTDTTNLTPETALQTLYISLYPNLSEDLPTLDPINTEDTYTDLIGNPAVRAARGAFLVSWNTSVEVKTRYQIENSKNQTRTTSKSQTPNLVTKLEEEKKTAHKVTSNRLKLYVYAVIKDKLEPPKGPVITLESIQEATKSLRQYISLNQLETVRLDKLIQLLHTVHGKQREFTAELVAILQREALLQHVNLSKSNNDLNEEKEKLEKKLKATDIRLKSSKVDSGKTEQLRKEYNLKVKALDKCELHIDKLQSELKEAKEQAEQLQSAADSNSQVDNLQQALKEEIVLHNLRQL
jgi:hypothetical protein